MSTLVKFNCLNCDAKLTTDRTSVGLACECPTCKANLTVPAPTAMVRLRTKIDDEIELFEDEYDFLLESPQAPASAPSAAGSGITPVELRMPGALGGLKAQVDQPTSNAMATTFLGGLLVVIGACLFAMFGGKSNSA